MNGSNLLQSLLESLVSIIIVVLYKEILEVSLGVPDMHARTHRTTHHLALVTRIHNLFSFMNLAIRFLHFKMFMATVLVHSLVLWLWNGGSGLFILVLGHLPCHLGKSIW